MKLSIRTLVLLILLFVVAAYKYIDWQGQERARRVFSGVNPPPRAEPAQAAENTP